MKSDVKFFAESNSNVKIGISLQAKFENGKFMENSNGFFGK